MATVITRSILKVLGFSSLLLCLSANSAFAEGHAVVGKKIADFTAKVTSVTYLEDRNVLNLESDGDIGPYGTVGVTATFMSPVDEKGTTGAYSARGASFRPDGVVVSFSSHGVWKSLGGHRWEVKTIGFNTEGDRSLAVGVLELKSMSFKGSIYDLN